MADEPQRKKPSKKLGYLALMLSIGGTGCLFAGPWGAVAGVALGLLAVVLEFRAPERHAGGGAAMAAILIGGGGLWFWKSAGPHIGSRGELRYRSAMTGAAEVQAIGALRELGSFEAGYAEANGGAYGGLACLVEPRKCVHDYPAAAPVLTGSWPGFSKAGAYAFTFHPGAKTAQGLASYAAVAIPRVPGETGRRGLCVDSTGIVRETHDGSAPAVENGLCAASTPPLR